MVPQPRLPFCLHLTFPILNASIFIRFIRDSQPFSVYCPQPFFIKGSFLFIQNSNKKYVWCPQISKEICMVSPDIQISPIRTDNGSPLRALTLQTRPTKFLPPADSNLAEVVPAGTRGEHQLISKENSKCRWMPTWDRSKPSRLKPGTR